MRVEEEPPVHLRKRNVLHVGWNAVPEWGQVGNWGVHHVWWLFEDSSGRSELGKWCCGSDSSLGTGSLGDCNGNICILAQGWALVAQWCEKAVKRRGPTTYFCKNPISGALQRMELGQFEARKGMEQQKLLQRANTAQWGQKNRFFFPPGSQRRTYRICCKPENRRKVDGVRLNLKARICPARTMRFVTNFFHHSVLFCAFSSLISAWD